MPTVIFCKAVSYWDLSFMLQSHVLINKTIAKLTIAKKKKKIERLNLQLSHCKRAAGKMVLGYSDFKESQVRLTQNWKGKKIPYFGYWTSEFRLRCKWEQSKADLICAILSKMSKTLSGNEEQPKALVPSGDNSSHGPWLICQDVEFHTFLRLF